MNYYIANKSNQYRLEEARRAQEYMHLVRHEQALRESRRPKSRPGLRERLGKWTAVGVRRWTRDGGAA